MAEFTLPQNSKITEGKTPLAHAAGVSKVKASGNSVTCELTSGHYKFTASWKA